MYTSIFEIIGPAMIGPSSSHTAGMVRIGMMARRIAGAPGGIAICLHPTLRYLYKGHRTDAALVGGAIGMDQQDDRLRGALDLALEEGVEIGPITFLANASLHPNTVQLRIENEAGVCTVRGISIGGGSIIIDQIDGAPFSLRPDAYQLIFWSKDDISAALYGVDKGSLSGGRGEAGYVYALTFSSLPPPATRKALAALAGVRRQVLVEPVMDFGLSESAGLKCDSCEEVVTAAAEGKKPIAKLALEYEAARSGRSEEQIRQHMQELWQVMKESAQKGWQEENVPLYGLVDGRDSKRLQQAIGKGKTISRGIVPRAVATALGIMERNASMGRIVAAPTAGSAGIVPACLYCAQQEYGLPDSAIVDALLAGSLFGVIMAHRGVSFSGAVGGCQGEVGVSCAIAAASMANLFSQDPSTPAQAMAMALKNMLGLVCDPIAGPIEVPCVKRNALGVANAYTAADMALAGIVSYVPPDQVIDALVDVELRLPADLKGGGCGGLACTPKAKALRQSLEDGSFF